MILPAAGQRVWRGGYEHHRPVVGGWLSTGTDRYAMRQERDPEGGELPLSDPNPQQTYVSQKFGEPMYIEGGDPFDYSSGYEIDGMPVSAAEYRRMAQNGSLAIDVAVGAHYAGQVQINSPLWPGWTPGNISVTRTVTMHSQTSNALVEDDGTGHYRVVPGTLQIFPPREFKITDSFTIGGFGFFGGQGPAPQPHPTPTPTPIPTPRPGQSICSAFAQMLAGLAAEYRDDVPIAASHFGRILGGMALAHNKLKKSSQPPSGFKHDLVSGGQNSDVFHHIYGFAGAYLIGDEKAIPIFGDQTGNEYAENQWKRDVDEFNHPEQPHPGEAPGHTAEEAYAEMMDDIAGHNVGVSIGEYFRGKISSSKLRQFIFSELCDN